MIENHVAQHTENVADSTINLWEKMANEIISIIGTGGFNSLYVRSLFLSQPTFPWLAAGTLAAQPDHRFTELKSSFEAQSPAQICAANRLLLITFTDILASLIGEQLTSNILRSAWSSEECPATHPKESKNE